MLRRPSRPPFPPAATTLAGRHDARIDPTTVATSLEEPAIVRVSGPVCLGVAAATLAAIAAASAGLTVLAAVTGRDYVFGFVPAFQATNAATVVAWGSTAALAIAAALAGLVAWLSRGPAGHRPGWWMLAAALALASLSRLTMPLVPAAWVVPAAFAATGAALWRTGAPRAPAAVWLGLGLIAVAPLIAGTSGASLVALIARATEWGGALAVSAGALGALAVSTGGTVTFLGAAAPAEGTRMPAVVALSARSVLVAAGAALVTLTVTSLVIAGLRQGLRWPIEGAYRFLYVDFEGGLPAWYSSMLLLAAAAAAGLLAAGDRALARADWRSWGLIAAGFVALSCDEAASLHELLNEPLRGLLHDLPALRFPLVLPGAVAAMAAGAVLARFLLDLPGDTRRGLLTSAAVFLGGVLGFETVGGWFDPVLFGDSAAYLALTTAEEACEMAGVTGALHAMLRHFERHAGPLTLHVGAPDGSPARQG